MEQSFREVMADAGKETHRKHAAAVICLLQVPQRQTPPLMADLAVHHSLALPEDGAHGALAALSDKVPLKVYCAGEDVAARAAADQNLLTSLARLLHHSHLRIRGTDRHNPTGVQQAGKFEMQPRQRERQCRRQAGDLGNRGPEFP